MFISSLMVCVTVGTDTAKIVSENKSPLSFCLSIILAKRDCVVRRLQFFTILILFWRNFGLGVNNILFVYGCKDKYFTTSNEKTESSVDRAVRNIAALYIMRYCTHIYTCHVLNIYSPNYTLCIVVYFKIEYYIYFAKAIPTPNSGDKKDIIYL